MPNPKNRKMGTDELKELIKSAVKEAMSGTKDDGATDAPLDGISTSDVLGVIEQAIEAVSEKHKADVEAGGEDNGVTTEEIVQEAAAQTGEGLGSFAQRAWAMTPTRIPRTTTKTPTPRTTATPRTP